MQPMIDYILANPGQVALGVYCFISACVAATRRKDDDAALARFMQRVSFLAPWNVRGIFSLPGRMPKGDEDPRGGAMLIVLLCFAPLLGGCAHRQAIRAFVRGASCATCDALGGEAGCNGDEE